LVQQTKLEKYTKMAIKVPNGQKIYHMAMDYTKILHLKPSKIYQNWHFGMKIYHLATLTGGYKFAQKLFG
jgi:hypothetical protein